MEERKKKHFSGCVLKIEPVGFPNGLTAKQKKELDCLQDLPNGDFPGSPVVKTPCFQCKGRGFHPWSGN